MQCYTAPMCGLLPIYISGVKATDFELIPNTLHHDLIMVCRSQASNIILVLGNRGQAGRCSTGGTNCRNIKELVSAVSRIP